MLVNEVQFTLSRIVASLVCCKNASICGNLYIYLNKHSPERVARLVVIKEVFGHLSRPKVYLLVLNIL